MCIIIGEVKDVSKTRILVAKLEGGKRQLTVYTNRIAMDGDVKDEDGLFSSHDTREFGDIMRFFSGEGDDEGLKGHTTARTDTRNIAAECSFRQTQRRHMPQTYYNCRTCNQGEGEGICDVCVSHCHQGHQMSPQKYGNFFCDCGADNPNCLGMRTKGVQWQAPGSQETGKRSTQGSLASKTLGAMILPVPNGKTCIPVDLSGYTDLFDDLDALFPTLKSQSYGSNSASLEMFDSANALVVQQVGSFKVSVVPTLQDFDRLRHDVFNLDPNAKQLLGSFYRDGYGFMVCQLDAGADFHPIGYTHALFSNQELFVPTVHYHGGDTNNTDWDHEIYVWGKRSNALDRFLDSQRNRKIVSGLNWVRSNNNDPTEAMQAKGFSISVGRLALQGQSEARPIAQKLNRILGSKGYLNYNPFVYRLKVDRHYAYNHDTLLHC